MLVGELAISDGNGSFIAICEMRVRAAILARVHFYAFLYIQFKKCIMARHVYPSLSV